MAVVVVSGAIVEGVVDAIEVSAAGMVTAVVSAALLSFLAQPDAAAAAKIIAATTARSVENVRTYPPCV